MINVNFFPKKILNFVFLFLGVFIVNKSILIISNVYLISSISIDVFSIFTSFIISLFIVNVLTRDEFSLFKVEFKRSILFVFNIIILIFVDIILFFNEYNYTDLVFIRWNDISILYLFTIIILFLYILYFSSYILNKLLFKAINLNIYEKIIFYPVSSFFIFAFINCISYFNINILSNNYIYIIINLMLILSIFIMIKFKDDDKISIKIGLDEIILFSSLILIFFIQFNALGGYDAFIRGDSTGATQNIGFINKYGIFGYMHAPLTEHYPVFYFLSWSTITKLLPFPYCNTVIIIQFFNEIFMLLSFYLFSTKLFNNKKRSIFCLILFLLLNGFSWFYVIGNNSNEYLKQNYVQDIYSKIVYKFGTESGSKISLLYADDHALARLWSLGLLFITMYALLNYIQGNKESLIFFIIGFISISLGHTAEVILIGIFIFSLNIIKEFILKKDFLISIFISLLFITFISQIFNYFSIIYFSIIYISVIIMFSYIINRYKLFNLYNFNKFTLKNYIKKTIIYFYLLYYSISIISFIIFYNVVNISTPIVTLWYSLPIQLGFPGLLFAIFLFIYSKHDINFDDHGTLFGILSLFILLLITILVNISNIYFFYVLVPAYIVPYYFLPILAISSSQLIKYLNSNNYNKYKIFLLTLTIIFITVGSYNHIISSSYWKKNSWYSGNIQESYLSEREIKFVNFLHRLPASNFEFIDYLPSKLDNITNLDPDEYQINIRYNTYKVTPLILLSGMKIPQKISMYVLYNTKNINEVKYLLEFLNIKYLVIEKNSTCFLSQYLKNNGIKIFDELYDVYDISFLSTKNNNQEDNELIMLDDIYIKGNVSFISNNTFDNKNFKNIVGVISPLENKYIIEKICAGESNESLKDDEYNEKEYCIYDDASNFWEVGALGEGSLSKISLLNEKEIKMKGNTSLKIDIKNDGMYEWLLIYHSYTMQNPRDWSNKDYIGIYLFGSNSNGIISIVFYGGGGNGSNACIWNIIDNFNGWKYFLIDLKNPDLKGSNYQLSSIIQIQIRWNTPGTKYLDRFIIDSWTKNNATVSKIFLEGDITITNFWATWQYFPHVFNVAQKIIINGKVELNILNSFENQRLYVNMMKSSGDIKIVPESWQVTETTARKYMVDYINNENISYLNLVQNIYLILWFILFSIIFYIYSGTHISLKNKKMSYLYI